MREWVMSDDLWLFELDALVRYLLPRAVSWFRLLFCLILFIWIVLQGALNFKCSFLCFDDCPRRNPLENDNYWVFLHHQIAALVLLSFRIQEELVSKYSIEERVFTTGMWGNPAFFHYFVWDWTEDGNPLIRCPHCVRNIPKWLTKSNNRHYTSLFNVTTMMSSANVCAGM
jgi:hypothetical protein